MTQIKRRIAVMGKQHELGHEQIAQRAYIKWLERGCPPGDGSEDWFAARGEIEMEMYGHIEDR